MSTSDIRPDHPYADEVRHLRGMWFWLLLFGVAQVVLGLLAIGASFIATLAVTLTFGVLLMVGGVVALAGAFSVRRWAGFFLQLLAGILYLVIGLFCVRHPVEAAAALTLLVAAGFLVAGLLRIIVALTHRFHGWGWVLLNGVVTFLLGALVWSQWPQDTVWLIGLCVGIDLLFHGWAWVMFALAVRSLPA
jgi:uncharacterized membrane protein HdeD (DUF308 family)